MSRPPRRRRRTPVAESVPSHSRARRWFVAVGVLFAVAAGAGTWWWIAGGPLPGVSRPGPLNVLLITLDTTRTDYLGCYGRANSPTPNIDRVAAEGALFTRCTTCSPFTLPSHASILTGLYPYVHGARYNASGRLADSNITLAETLKAAGLATQATIASVVLNGKWGTGQGFDVYHDIPASEIVDELHAERRGDVVCADALEMLRSLADRQFFLWVHYYDPHHPYNSPRIADSDSPAAYEDEIRFMDQQVGRLLDEVARLYLDRKTLVVLVSDHGEGLGDHGELLHGTFLYETTLHTGLIFRCPGVIDAGRVIGARVRTIDIAPTILDLLRLPAWPHAEGVSLVPLLAGQKQDLDLAAYAESLDGQVLFGLALLRSLTRGDWKYVHAPRPELYNLASDPGESHNLSAERPDLTGALREELRALLADAPPPPAAEARRVPRSASDTALLESLGYVGAHTAAGLGEESAELDAFEPQGGDPKDYAPMFVLRARASGALREKEYSRGERMLRELIAALPHAPSLHLDLARALREQNRVPEADEEYRRALALAPHDVSARHTYGRFLLYSAQRFADAVEQLESALAQSRDDAGILHDLGVASLGLGRFSQAEGHLQRALALEPNNPRFTQALGVLRLKQNRLAEAAECFRRTLALDSDSAEAQAALQWLSQHEHP